jgi:hypothetical protein
MITRRRPIKSPESFAAGLGRGLRRAAGRGREVARMHRSYDLRLGKLESDREKSQQRD